MKNTIQTHNTQQLLRNTLFKSLCNIDKPEVRYTTLCQQWRLSCFSLILYENFFFVFSPN